MTREPISQPAKMSAPSMPRGYAADPDVVVGRVVHGTFGATYRVPMMIDVTEALTDAKSPQAAVTHE